MRPADIEHLVSLSAPAVHPSGDHAVVAASHPSLHANRQVGQLWRVSLDDGSRRRITQGVHDRAPRYTADGRALLFLRADAKGKAQVWAMDAAGGEPVQATDAPGGVTAFDVSRAGDRIAFTATNVEHGRFGTVDGVDAAAESPRLIHELAYRSNGRGYTRERWTHVFVAPMPELGGEPVYERAAHPHDGADGAEQPKPAAKTAAATQLTHGDFNHSSPRFTADGTRIVAVTARHDSREHDLLSSVVELDVDGGEPHTVLSSRAGLSVHEAVPLADGSIALLAQDMGETGRDFVARNAALWMLPGAGETPVRRTDDATIDLGEVGSHMSALEDAVLVQDRTRGRVQLVRVEGERVERLTEGDIEVTGHGAGGGRVVVSVATPTSMGELGVVEHGRVRILTDFGTDLAASGIAEPHELEVTGRDGTPVHGWVWVPEGPGPHPVLLNIHGGPFAQYGVHVFDEAQVAVDAGYAVVQCNPRGSAGYGRDHGLAIKERMGTVDMHDVLDFLDGAIAAHPELDAGRTGIMGGSYGGYLTAWTIAHEHRFAAAIVERGYLDPETFIGTSDIGWFFSEEYTGKDAEHRRSQSPMALVDRVTTPTLVVHSELDDRCPLEQAQRYFSALKRQGTETALLVFPGEDHELTRSGQPRHRLERFEHVLAWWAKHLPTARNHA